MKIPEKVKIGPNVWDIVYEDKPVEGNTLCYGICKHRDFEIVLAKDLKYSNLKDTFLHECLHAIDDTYDINLNEHQVHVLATSLLDFILTNNLNFLK